MADTNLFVDISHYIKTKPKEFRNVGKWLDESCSEKGYCDRLKEKIKEIERKKHNIAGHVYEREKKSLEEKLESGRVSSLLFRFGEVRKELFEKYKDEMFISIDVARRILLIAWILSDPDTEIVNLKITELEKWLWEPVDDVTKMSRGFSSYLFRQNPLNTDLVKRAWEKIGRGDSNKAIKWYINLIQLFKTRLFWEKVVVGVVTGLTVAFILWLTRNLWLGLIGKSKPPIAPNSVTNQMGPNSTSQIAIGKDINQVLNIDNSHKEDKHIEFKITSETDPNIVMNIINYVNGLPKSDNPEYKELFEKGGENIKGRNYKDAIQEFTRCLELSSEDAKRGGLNLLIGDCYYELRQYSKAAEYYATGLRDSSKANDLQGKAFNLAGIASTYLVRPAHSGEVRGNNVQKAIEFYTNALNIFNKDEYPVEYARAQNNLGISYFNLPAATLKERAKNINSAINCYRTSLDIRRKLEYPFDYATTQNNLGTAYACLPATTDEERAKNINIAMDCYRAALEIRRREEYPFEYAGTQTNLGSAYTDLPSMIPEEVSRNIKMGIKCYKSALEIYTKDKYPIEYAGIQNNLGNAYRLLAVATPEERARNINVAIEFYRLALEIKKKDEYPQDYSMLAQNVGISLALIKSPDACYWLKESYALREYLDDQGKGVEEVIRQICNEKAK